MIAWLLRGLRRGSVTTSYPKQPELPPAGMRSRIAVVGGGGADADLAALCPTGAIEVDNEQVRVDRGRCILCGLCVERAPNRFAFEPAHETASRDAPWALGESSDVAPAEDLRPTLRQQAAAFRRSSAHPPC